MINEIELMSNYESMISELYQKFADTFPEHYDFWKSISDEEIEHSSWIITLSDDVDSGVLKLHKSVFTEKFRFETIDKLRDLLNNYSDNITLKEACDIALAIEQHMLEKEYLSLFSGGHEAFVELTENLAKETREHVKRLIIFRDKNVNLEKNHQ